MAQRSADTGFLLLDTGHQVSFAPSL